MCYVVTSVLFCLVHRALSNFWTGRAQAWFKFPLLLVSVTRMISQNKFCSNTDCLHAYGCWISAKKLSLSAMVPHKWPMQKKSCNQEGSKKKFLMAINSQKYPKNNTCVLKFHPAPSWYIGSNNPPRQYILWNSKQECQSSSHWYLLWYVTSNHNS